MRKIATTVASRKQKGRKAQQLVRDTILNTYSELTERDVVSQPMGVPGADIRLSEIASKVFPFSVEVKACEALSVWAAFKQCETNADIDKLTPLLCFKRNRTPMYVMMKLKDFIKCL